MTLQIAIPNVDLTLFTDTPWSTAREKQRFVLHFFSFVLNGYRRDEFPRWFYQRLSLTFGHIAHFNEQVFYEYFFSSKARKTQFLIQTEGYPGYGDPSATWSDAERIITDWVRTNFTALVQDIAASPSEV